MKVEFCVVTGLQVECNNMCDQTLCHYHPIHGGPSAQQVIRNQRL